MDESKSSHQPQKDERNSWRYWIVGLIVAGVLVTGYLIADWYQTVSPTVERAFVGRESCVGCHQKEADLFHGSHHDLAMDIATPETVFASFDGQEIEHFGIRSRVFMDGERFMVNTEGPDGQMHDYEVKYVFGVTPLQQYMVEIDGPKTSLVSDDSNGGNKISSPLGRVQVLRLSWDTLNEKWFYLLPPDVDEKIQPDDPLHWTGITQSWNTSCAECHSTNIEKNFDPLSRKFSTTFSEIDVSCEACHGPGSLHVELANRKSLFWDRKQGFGLHRLKSTSNLPQIETCAPCHSRRGNMGGGTVGCSFDDYYSCQLIEDQIYHDDGQIRDEDYVYGSFIQSKMYHNDIRCTDCHDPHSTKVKFPDNRLCTSCHQHPAAKYDSISHHHHQEGSAGALCVECHMPATTYMEVDPRRDHSFRIPRPDMSVKFSTPNACTGCHLDITRLKSEEDGVSDPPTQYLDWLIARDQDHSEITAELSRVDRQMAAAFEEWYPVDPAAPRAKYYEQLVRGKTANDLPTLIALATDRSAPGIFRASAAMELADDPSRESLEVAIKALEDPNIKVASAALMRVDQEIGRISNRLQYSQSQDLREYKELVELVAGLLDHSSRRIRIEAARVYVYIPVAARPHSNSETRRNFDAAFAEFRRSLLTQNDRAMSHMMLAGLYEMTGRAEKAMDAYRTAIRVEPNLAGPRWNLAAILDGQSQMLENQLRPQSGNSMSAGQMRELANRFTKIQEESKRLRAEEHELLRIDVERSKGLPGIHGLLYRFAMSSYIQNDLEATEKYLLEAIRQEPQFPNYLLALSAYYQQQQNYQEAAKYVERLIEVDPQNPGYRSLAEEISRQLESPELN